jgi:hypothetical protein
MQAYPTYSYRYRLQLSIEVDGKVHTGASVIEVTWRTGPNAEVPGVISAQGFVRGQAPIIDVGSRGVVIASLISGGARKSAEGISALYLGTHAFGLNVGAKDLQQLEQMTGRRDLPADGWPRLLWLPDRFRSEQQDTKAKGDRLSVSNPFRVVTLTADELPATIGASARFVEAFVEITNDPVVFDIELKLPWYRVWRTQLQRKPSLAVSPSAAMLSPNWLVRDGI